MVELLLMQKFEIMEKHSASGVTGSQLRISQNVTGSQLRISQNVDMRGTFGGDFLRQPSSNSGLSRGGTREQLIVKSQDFAKNQNAVAEDFDNAHFGNQEELNKLAERFSKLVPNLKKKDLENMYPEDDDEIKFDSEELTVQWVHAFLEEIERIEFFFKSKQEELINEFIHLQDKFRMKTDHYL